MFGKHSKAELGLRQLATETGIEVVIIRPPLVYGLGVKANFQSMMRWLHRMGQALGKPARLIPVPASLLEAGAALLGRRDMAQRPCGSLQVDISKAKTLLGWSPPISVDEGLRRAAQGFLKGKAI